MALEVDSRYVTKMNHLFLSHVKNKNPGMVDVGFKKNSERKAVASCELDVPEPLVAALKDGTFNSPKGPVFHTAIIAGTMAAKNTSLLIPLCHPLMLSHVGIEITLKDKKTIAIECEAKAFGPTGVEMEALTGASIAALTIYDMLKAVSSAIEIKKVCLIEKTGGKCDYKRNISE